VYLLSLDSLFLSSHIHDKRDQLVIWWQDSHLSVLFTDPSFSSLSESTLFFTSTSPPESVQVLGKIMFPFNWRLICDLWIVAKVEYPPFVYERPSVILWSSIVHLQSASAVCVPLQQKCSVHIVIPHELGTYPTYHLFNWFFPSWNENVV
jgi:hypothetical protein